MSDHYYDKDGMPRHFVPKKTGTGDRPSTIADARKNGWLPSVTTVLKVLARPELQKWIIQQHVMAAVTTPRSPEEGLDAFVERIMAVDAQSEVDAAKDLGTRLHDALENAIQGKQIGEEDRPWIAPALDAVTGYGKVIATEEVLVGDGYAGKTDLILQAPDGAYWIWDYKTTKKLPDPAKGAWRDHKIQAAAYAAAWARKVGYVNPIRTANLYISTTDCGKFVICEHQECGETYQNAFLPALKLWQWMNSYVPPQ